MLERGLSPHIFLELHDLVYDVTRQKLQVQSSRRVPFNENTNLFSPGHIPLQRPSTLADMNSSSLPPALNVSSPDVCEPSPLEQPPVHFQPPASVQVDITSGQLHMKPKGSTVS